MQRIFVFVRGGADVSLVVHSWFIGVESMIEVVVVLMIGLKQPSAFWVGVSLDIAIVVPERILNYWLFLLHEG